MMYRYSQRVSFIVICMLLVSVLAACTSAIPNLSSQQRPIDRVKHLIVISQENWSFDALYGHFPNANGLTNAGNAVKQVDKNGVPFKTLPQPIDNTQSPPIVDKRFPADLPMQPFDIMMYAPADQKIGDPTHRFYQEQYQINDGKMDRFIAWGDTGALPMSFFDARKLPIGEIASQYTVADNFFHGAFGGSMLNHFWMVCACTPQWPDAPSDMIAQLDDKGMLIKDGAVTSDKYLINNAESINQPHPPGIPEAQLVPNLHLPTIGDRLSEKNVSWAWYTGGWEEAIAGHADPDFGYGALLPFIYFANYADGTPGRAEHLRDEEDFLSALKQNKLPEISFIKPLENEHPGLDLLSGEQHVADLVQVVQNSPYWNDTVIIITYDENGGRWDHVAPPKVDRWGPGTRVPTIIISPFAKKGYIDHTLYDTTSILKFIETRWNIAPLGVRDAAANDMLNAFDFK